MSLLGTGNVGVYIDSSIRSDDYVGLQYMEMIPYGSMFGVMKDVSNGLWDAVFCILQGNCAFVLEFTNLMVTESFGISIFEVESDRNSKGSKILRNFPLTR